MAQFEPTARTLRAEVVWDLEEMQGELEESAAAWVAISKACDHELRRLARINMIRRRALDRQRKAANLDSDAAISWDGVGRRSTDIWLPSEVAA